MKSKGLVQLTGLLLLGMLIFSGCGDDNSVTSDDQSSTLTDEDVEVIADDFASTLAEEDEGLIVDWTDVEVSSQSSVLTTSSLVDGIVVADTARNNRGNLTITRVNVFYDSLGNTYDHYVADTTIALDRMLTISGTRTNMHETRTSTLEHSDSTRIVGISPEETIRTLNGEGERHVTSEFLSYDSTKTHSFEGNYEWALEDLTVEKENPYPLSGTVYVDVSRYRESSMGDSTTTMSVETSLTVVFDGTNIATVTLADGTTFTINLDEARVNRRPR